ncbi:MAG: DUF6599 family protein [bacterium]
MKSAKYFILLIILVLITAGALLMWNASSDLGRLLPTKLQGWEIAGRDKVYNRQNLYDYIDGGAELYLSYGFEQLLNRTYTAPGQPDIVVDLFDMGSSHDAYGVFSHSKETEDTTFGQGSQYTQGLLLCWKDRYFVSILASPETVASRKAVFNLASQIDAAIETEGPLPEIVYLLPPESLVRESIRYFHHHVWLNSYYFVADENILHIDDNTEALLAKYGSRQKRYFLLIVKYANAGDAEMAHHDFVTSYLPELAEEQIVQIEDGTWTGCQREKNYVIIVFNAPTKEQAARLISEVRKNCSASKGSSK